MPVFDPLPDECCQAAALTFVTYLAPDARVAMFTCPTCLRGHVLVLRPDEEPVRLVRAGGTYHRADCALSLHGRAYAEGEALHAVFARTLWRRATPQPCPICLGRDVAAYLGVLP